MFYNTDGLVNGATRQKLTQATMRNMLIPMRSIEEQKHIVELLNRVVEIKLHRQNELTKLDELIKARFVELFGTLEKPVQNFRRATLKELCSKITDYVRENGDIQMEDLVQKSPFDHFNIQDLFGANIVFIKQLVNAMHNSIMVA